MKFRVLFFSGFFAAFSCVALAKEPLPLSVTINFDLIDGLEEFDGGKDALGSAMHEQLENHFVRKFPIFWTIGPKSFTHTLNVEVELDEDDWQPIFTLTLGPNRKDIVFFSKRKIGSPAKTGFQQRLQKAFRRALKGSYDRLYAASREIHDGWNFGVSTKILLKRELKETEATRYRDDQLKIHWPHAFRTLTVDTSPPEPFAHHFVLAPNVERKAFVYHSPHTGWLGTEKENRAELCIRRDMSQTPVGVTPSVIFECPTNGQCELRRDSVLPKGWASSACEAQGHAPNFIERLFGVSTAHANKPSNAVWQVPSLSTLVRRLNSDDKSFVGFTEFEIESEPLYNIDADAYSAHITVNGTPVWLDGIPPEDNRINLDVEDGILLRFGLENLQFSGRRDGCEDLEIRLHFYKDGNKLDRHIDLGRKYAALRHAELSRHQKDGVNFEWSGLYTSPAARRETGLFLKSSRLFFRGDRSAAKKAREDMNAKRDILDGFNWQIRRGDLGGTIGNSKAAADEMVTIVGKIRPPARQKRRQGGDVAYGLLAGIEYPNGQLQFSFDNEQISNLRDLLLQLRRSERKSRTVVPAKASGFYKYTYTEARKQAPNWVCYL